MSIYKEQKNKLNLDLSDSEKKVKIKIDCYNGTIGSVSFYHNNPKTLKCGQTRVIGKAKDLKNKNIEFNGAANNPDGEDIKIVHTIFEENGETITYSFPENFSGNPDFDPNDEHPDYKFFLNLR